MIEIVSAKLTLGRAREKAAAGAAFLDDLTGGRGWREHIDSKRLDMNHESWCVLGQLYGNYWQATDSLGLTNNESANYGFTFWNDESTENITAAWREEIARNA